MVVVDVFFAVFGFYQSLFQSLYQGIMNNFFGVKVGTFKEPETLKLYMCFRLP